MGESILAAFLSDGTPPEDLIATVRRAARASELRNRYAIDAGSLEDDPQANRLAVQGAEMVILCPKPNGIRGLAGEISSAVSPRNVVVSIAAAIPLALLQASLPAGQPTIRIIPNTPVRVRYGVIEMTPGHRVSAQQLHYISEDVFGSWHYRRNYRTDAERDLRDQRI